MLKFSGFSDLTSCSARERPPAGGEHAAERLDRPGDRESAQKCAQQCSLSRIPPGASSECGSVWPLVDRFRGPIPWLNSVDLRGPIPDAIPGGRFQDQGIVDTHIYIYIYIYTVWSTNYSKCAYLVLIIDDH